MLKKPEYGEAKNEDGA